MWSAYCIVIIIIIIVKASAVLYVRTSSLYMNVRLYCMIVCLLYIRNEGFLVLLFGRCRLSKYSFRDEGSHAQIAFLALPRVYV